MAKWVHANVLDFGIDYIKQNATRMHLIKAYSAGDSYSTVVTTNGLGYATMAPGDFTLSSSGSNRVCTTASGKSATATAASGASPNLHIAFTNATDTVYWVTDETSDAVVIIGNVINFPVSTYTSIQPT